MVDHRLYFFKLEGVCVKKYSRYSLKTRPNNLLYYTFRDRSLDFLKAGKKRSVKLYIISSRTQCLMGEKKKRNINVLN